MSNDNIFDTSSYFIENKDIRYKYKTFTRAFIKGIVMESINDEDDSIFKENNYM